MDAPRKFVRRTSGVVGALVAVVLLASCGDGGVSLPDPDLHAPDPDDHAPDAADADGDAAGSADADAAGPARSRLPTPTLPAVPTPTETAVAPEPTATEPPGTEPVPAPEPTVAPGAARDGDRGRPGADRDRDGHRTGPTADPDPDVDARHAVAVPVDGRPTESRPGHPGVGVVAGRAPRRRPRRRDPADRPIAHAACGRSGRSRPTVPTTRRRSGGRRVRTCGPSVAWACARRRERRLTPKGAAMSNVARRCTTEGCAANGRVQAATTCPVCGRPTVWTVLRVPPPGEEPDRPDLLARPCRRAAPGAAHAPAGAATRTCTNPDVRPATTWSRTTAVCAGCDATVVARV